MKTLLVAGETSQANFDGAETKYLVDKRNFETANQALFIDAPYDGVIVETKEMGLIQKSHCLQLHVSIK
jgi:hypothetical protein